jgi:diguanylate cyclase (GGDEF)-like protein
MSAYAHLRHLASKATEPQLLFPGLALLLTALLWVGTGMLIKVERQLADDSALAQARELTETYEAQVLRVLREIEQSFKLIQYAYEQQAPQQILFELSSRELLPPALLFNVAVLTPAGDTLTGSAPLKNPLTIDNIQEQRNKNQMIVSVPEAGAISQNLLQFRRRVLDHHGEFAGIAVIEVDADFFASSYNQERMGKQGLLALLGQDGQFRVRRVGDQTRIGEKVGIQRYMEDIISELETVSLLRASPLDGVKRYLAARELFGFPLVVVVGLSQEEQMAPVDARANTYIVRAAVVTLLLLAVLALLWRLSYQLAQSRRHEMQARINHAQQVEYLAYHDGLTGLPNRSLFSKLLNQNINQAKRNKKRLALMFLDLDHFKHINDTLGHDAGDQLLQEVAQRLKSNLRNSDVVARLGGDEFVMVLPEVTDPAYTASVARKVIAAVALPYRLAGQDFRVTASIGISTYPDDGTDEQTLTKNADVAMYKAKQEGKNNFQLYSTKLHSESLERLSLESSLRHALERNELELHYQARRDIASGNITGIEALLYWQHPDMGLITPDHFLTIAEDIGLIIPIGRWILKTACQQNKQWLQEGLPPQNIAVKLSATQFFAESLLADAITALDSADMEPGQLELEVSEGVLIQNVDKALMVIESLKAAGLRIAIDNFGVGYSSLSLLRRFPLDTINIDRSFIRNLSGNEQDISMTEAIVAMGRTLGLSMIAQGVETEAQVEYLRRQSVNELQGFYCNHPLPATEFGAVLRKPPRRPRH